MRVDDFDFELPEALIAQHPVAPRDAARLLVVGHDLADRHVHDLPDLLRAGDLLVFNDTRVIPARLEGRRGEARVEVTLIEQQGPGLWHALARPARKLKPGDRIDFAPDFVANVVERGEGGAVVLWFDLDDEALRDRLQQHGAMPLPPYIRRERGGDPADRERYQTLFAHHEGAVAAPTAGLHFTPGLMGRLDRTGVRSAFLTLHVGAGTFLPVKAEDTREHVMHAERFELSEAVADAVAAARARGGRVVAVGTTVLRTLEACADGSGGVRPDTGATSLFITPGYRFQVADLLLTNFHLPRSTLFMLVAAFGGLARMREAYAHAIRHGYRFYSYGDATLLERPA